MPTFNLVSDMHLNFADITMPGGDVLIMAGDIIEAGHMRLADNAGRNTFLADRYRRFIAQELCKYQKVVYVFGNHEHYDNTYQDTRRRLQKEMPDNVTILESESMQIDDVHIFGGTLWTDMNGGDPMTMHAVGEGMNDFKCIKHEQGSKFYTATGAQYYSNKFSPKFARYIHTQTMADLKLFCEAHVNDKVLVVSHHAPTELSLDPRYKPDYYMNGGYHSRLSEFILDHPCIRAWCHGHVHTVNDYMMGTCRVMSNPRGYVGYEVMADDYNVGFEFTL